MKKEEQRSSFITIAINNANSTAATTVEAGEQEVIRTGTGGCKGWDCRGLGGPVAGQSSRLQRFDRFMGQTML